MSTRPLLDQNLKEVKARLEQMSILVERSAERAFRALRFHDTTLARAIVSDDSGLDHLRKELEMRITRISALQQPVAHDQRLLIAALLIGTDLERMADHATGIARSVLRDTNPGPFQAFPQQLTDMSRIAREMTLQAVEAFLAEDEEAAQATARRDDEIDSLYRDLFDDLTARMTSGELAVPHGTYLLWAGHSLERIGDRATNICERVLYAHSAVLDSLNPKSNIHKFGPEA